jgi:membrane protease YdiL (CAAX protease family)
MSPFAAIAPSRLLAAEAVFLFYVVVSFICVASYAFIEAKSRRLIDGAHSPLRFLPPRQAGWLFAVAVFILLFAQSPLYMILVAVGVTSFLVQSRRTATEQFGFDRLPLVRVATWSFLVCGAVIFVEVPLSALVDRIMTALHLPHPEQESVEFFRRISRPSDVFLFLFQAVFLSPLIEELFFRGFLFSFLKNYTSTTFALVWSAGVFAFAHANLGSVLQLWVLGVALGLAYEYSGSLLLAVGIHACWNLLTALGLLLQRGGA